MHARVLNRAVVVAAIALVTACSSGSRQPEWVDRPLDAYTADQYLSAVGEADSLDAASSRARANLGQIFRVAIKDSSQDFSRAVVSSVNGQQQVDNQQRIVRFVNTDARQVLEGTDIVESWHSPGGRVFSLAVLKKSTASRRFRELVRTADRETADLIDYASTKAVNPVVALRALESARLSQVGRDNANRNLSITAGKGMSGQYGGKEIESLIRQALASLKFAVNSDDKMIQAELENAVASLGIQQQQSSSYVLSSKLDTEPLQQKQGWWWLRGFVELELVNDGETIALQRWPVKQPSIEKGMAKQRLQGAVNKRLSSYLYTMLTAAPEK